MRYLTFLLLAFVLGLAGCTGGGETVVSGFGNSGNYFGEEDELVLLARAIAKYPGTPEITDRELGLTLDALRAQAVEGDPDAALVIYRVAAHQRAAREEAEEGS